MFCFACHTWSGMQEVKKANAFMESFADEIHMDAAKHAFTTLKTATKEITGHLQVTQAFVAEVFMIKALFQLHNAMSAGDSEEAQNDKQRALNTLGQQNVTILKHSLSGDGGNPKAKVAEPLFTLTKKAIEESRTRAVG